MTLRIILPALALAVGSTGVLAQQAMTFRLAPSDRNPGSCTTADATMSRIQTVTIVGETAVLKSNGGINDTAKKAGDGLYRVRWSLGGISYDIEVDTRSQPAMLSVAEPKIGCKWSGKAG